MCYKIGLFYLLLTIKQCNNPPSHSKPRKMKTRLSVQTKKGNHTMQFAFFCPERLLSRASSSCGVSFSAHPLQPVSSCLFSAAAGFFFVLASFSCASCSTLVQVFQPLAFSPWPASLPTFSAFLSIAAIRRFTGSEPAVSFTSEDHLFSLSRRQRSASSRLSSSFFSNTQPLLETRFFTL